MPRNDYHIPVMVNEVMDFLVSNPDGIYVDATTGGGGHSHSILSIISNRGKLLGVDLDEDALAYASRRLAEYKNYVNFNVGFDQVGFILESEEISGIDGVIYDLGISSYQIDEEHKGFAFMQDSPLDMRFSRFQKLTAEMVINEYEEEMLAEIFKKYGEERRSKLIASKIVEKRARISFKTTRQLVELISSLVPGKQLTKTLARVFQSIRIEVNDELGRLKRSLDVVFPFLKIGGRIVVLSYHSLEDRIIKNYFKEKSAGCICPPEFPVCKCSHKPEMKILTKKVIIPSKEEIRNNPRARSAKLRAAEKIEMN